MAVQGMFTLAQGLGHLLEKFVDTDKFYEPLLATANLFRTVSHSIARDYSTVNSNSTMRMQY